MANKRRTQWIDAIQATAIAVNGAAAPGTINEQAILTEGELENLGGGATLLRLVGDIWIRSSAGNSVITTSFYLNQQYAGAASVADWNQDAYQRLAYLGGYMTEATVGLTQRVMVDLRTKRKMGQGIALTMAFQNHNIGGNDARVIFHVRALLMLP